jgi:type III restriction enzyme
VAQSSGEIIGYYARLIAKDLKLPSQFNVLAPKIREFFATRAFGEPVDLDDPQIIRAMNHKTACFVTLKAFKKALAGRIVEHIEPELLTEARRLAEIQPFPFTNTSILEARKCVLNYAPCSNEFERNFGKFLDAAPDVAAWCKLPDTFGFSITYTDQNASLRYYFPDFVAKTQDGNHWLIETKGAETLEVAHKDAAARLWCENAALLTDIPWAYVKVTQRDFIQMDPGDFADLALLT